MPSNKRDTLQVLIFAIGTAGDVHPNIAIGRALRQRGHRVVLVSNSYFEPSVQRAGLEFLSTGPIEEYYRVISDPELWQLGKGLRIFLRELLAQMRPVYEIVSRHAGNLETVIVAPASAFGARIAYEKLGVPLVHLHLQPFALRSRYEQPGLEVPRIIQPFLRPLREVWLGALDRWVLDPAVLPETNAFRTELGLPPIRRPFDGWIHSPQLVIGLFPEWFAPPPRDWPRQVRLSGFPLYDDGITRETPADLKEFLEGGDPPVAFAIGSGMRFGEEFFSVSTEVCRRLGRRGVLITQFPEQLPKPLPPGVRHFDYVPFSALLPHAAAFVHHGGIGTMAQGLRAGVPQIITPFNFDQPDNAVRLKRLGVGDFIRPKDYQVAQVAGRLKAILSDPVVRDRCRAIAGKFKGADPIAETCNWIESAATKTETAHGR